MKVPPTPERAVAHDVRRALEQRHWRVIRNNVTKVQYQPGIWTQFAEPGMPDFLAIHYLDARGNALVCWVETKRFDGRLGENQRDWQGKEVRHGAVVIVAHSIDEFMDEYESRLAWIHRPPYSIPGHQAKLQLTWEE